VNDTNSLKASSEVISNLLSGQLSILVEMGLNILKDREKLVLKDLDNVLCFFDIGQVGLFVFIANNLIFIVGQIKNRLKTLLKERG
jgi:hypothetical protein